MARALATLPLALLVVVAGCQAPVDGTPSPTTASSEETTASETARPETVTTWWAARARNGA